MDFTQCFQLLESRINEKSSETVTIPSCACSSSQNNLKSISKNSNLATASTKICLSDEELVTILNTIFTLQAQRVMVYKDFDIKLASVVSNNDMHLYPSQCKDITDKFIAISNNVIHIKENLQMAEQTELANIINTIQAAEKQKLMLVAAKHMDILQDKVPSLQSLTGGKSTQQQVYLANQILEVETVIAEALDELQSRKCDLIH
mmetsp:Transcript_22124/g.31784  ORF Transcript_22124/g.31784 Transcript_22124/m.31784 type:complete len:205 (+) Transcript_22124:16-630(+)